MSASPATPAAALDERAGVVVEVTAPGLSPEALETLVASPLELALSPLDGVAAIHTLMREGIVQVRLVPEDAGDLHALRQQVMDALHRAEGMLPEDAAWPVLRNDAAPGEHVLVTLEGGALDDLVAVVHARLQSSLEALPGTRHVVACVPRREVAIELDPRALATHPVTARDVERTLRDALMPDFMRMTPPPAGDLARLTQVIVQTVAGQPLRVIDLAVVSERNVPGPCASQRADAVSLLVAIDLDALQTPPDAWQDAFAALAERYAARDTLTLTAHRLGAPDTTLAGMTLPQGGLEALGGPATLAETLAAKLDLDAAATLLVAAPGALGPLWMGAPDGWVVATESIDLQGLGTVPGTVFLTLPPDPTAILVRGAQRDELARAGEVLARALREEADVGGVIVEGASRAMQVEVKIDRERAAQLGLSVGEIASQLRRAMFGVEIGELADRPGPTTPVRVYVGPAPRGQAALPDLETLTVRTPTGDTVALSAVAQLSQSASWSSLLRRDSERVVVVRVSGTQPAVLARVLAATALPAGVEAQLVTLGSRW